MKARKRNWVRYTSSMGYRGRTGGNTTLDLLRPGRISRKNIHASIPSVPFFGDLLKENEGNGAS